MYSFLIYISTAMENIIGKEMLVEGSEVCLFMTNCTRISINETKIIDDLIERTCILRFFIHDNLLWDINNMLGPIPLIGEGIKIISDCEKLDIKIIKYEKKIYELSCRK